MDTLVTKHIKSNIMAFVAEFEKSVAAYCDAFERDDYEDMLAATTEGDNIKRRIRTELDILTGDAE